MIDPTDINPIVMASCIAWAKRWNSGEAVTFPLKSRSFIERIIVLRSAYARRADSPRGKASDIYPGYVVFEFSGKVVHVPFHLVDALPSDDELEHFFRLAEEVRLSPSSQICLSGSTVFRGRIASTADIDFCEYVPVRPESTRRVVQQRCLNISPTLFVNGRFDNKKNFTRAELAENSAFLDELKDAKTAKLDYVCSLAAFEGPLSNVSLFIDPASPEVAAHGKSWPFQEILLGTNAPFYQLMKPELLGRYMLWLIEEIDHYLPKRPIKAVKKSLSLSRVLGVGYQRLYSLLNRPELAEAQRRASLREALEMASHTSAVNETLVKELRQAIESLPAEEPNGRLGGIDLECRALVSEFRADVEELVQEADRTFEEQLGG